MIFFKNICITSLVVIFPFIVFGQNYGSFRNDDFPAHLIDSSIISKRDLDEQINMLSKECEWKNRIGKKIDVFMLQIEDGYLFGHVYEYFMDCDNLRLIYWQADPSGKGEVLDFMIEPLEDESIFVINKRQQLKNKKKYKEYLK